MTYWVDYRGIRRNNFVAFPAVYDMIEKGGTSISETIKMATNVMFKKRIKYIVPIYKTKTGKEIVGYIVPSGFWVEKYYWIDSKMIPYITNWRGNIETRITANMMGSDDIKIKMRDCGLNKKLRM